ncbi:hypothetical protein SAMN05216389_102320 [Oceanobacillus limi]|uniref:Short-chain dehydrogenase n=1 Tax=Oceanobacillus limi TaxID=930131 RepID=A0A1H9ZKB0_9BACI|nr:SDR family oxidoreductase [Oceanobacillus limi]SES82057.1 hypothetical protein SAMN05216389_102320 [Oceanobacillus limi]
MQDKLKNKKIIVTGASGGIGARIAWHIALNGGIPILLARSMEKLTEIQSKISRELQQECFVVQVDLTEANSVIKTFDRILLEHGKVHGLINNAGIGIFKEVSELSWEQIEKMFQVNVFALVKGTKVLLPHFLSQEEDHNHIVNIASQAGKMATPKSSAYAATKHAILGFTNALRMEVKNSKIFVTSVNLGPVRTGFFDVADPDGTYQRNIEKYMLDPDIVAQRVVHHLFRQKREINLPWWMEVGSKIYNLFPKFMESVLKNQFHKK